jgi:hypothetical protein
MSISTQQDELRQQLVAALTTQHIEWLKHPVTSRMFMLLKSHRENTSNKISASANTLAIPDAAIRHLCVSLANTDAIIEALGNTKIFVEKQTPQSSN